MEKDIALGVLAAIVTVAGLILVFCGFLFAKAESFDSRRGDKFRTLAKAGIIPLIASFVSAWICTMAIENNPWAVAHGLLTFKIALVISALYSIIALLIL